MAIRTNEVVLIDQIYWTELSDIQKVALLFHEALYTLIEPLNGSKSVYKARSLNGFIFSKLLAKETKETFSKRLHPLFPSEIKYPVAYHYITETQIHEITSVINPFMLISDPKRPATERFYITEKMNLMNPDQNHKAITDAICSGTELNIKLGAHTLVQFLDQGDNNSQQSLQLIEVEDLFFSPMHIPANIECKMRLSAIQTKLKKYFFDYL